METVVEMNQINNSHECNGHYNNLTNGETPSTERALLNKTEAPHQVSNSDEQVLI